MGNTATKKEEDDNQAPATKYDTPDEKTTQVINVVKSYFANLTNGNYEAAAQDNFAPSVDQWITMKNTHPKAIATEAKRFLSTKTDVKYTPNLAGIVLKDNKARVVVRQEWKGYDTTLEVWLEFDNSVKIKSYKEGKIFKMKIVKPSALEAYLSKIKKFEYPVNVNSQQYSTFKAMDKSGLNLLIKDAIEGENFQNIGYFEISSDLVGILYIRGYRSSQSIVLNTFNRKSGKAVAIEVVGFMGGGHMMAGYNQACDITIQANGKISNTWHSTTSGQEMGEQGASFYQITPNGQIVKSS
ncbi:hypothetical protein M23134_08212 [Microscilla marina ATCC 23134]|uniref:Uncharacterized protein n=1 Tax=Microscilla marina ATCC 23134 TaxID=313606 RepID=A1ZHB4_MICM2|nr:hypothetical protein M23134_08212 [Microscilla marina ATCC 23134]